MDGATWGETDGVLYPILMAVGILYPYIFDTIQLFKQKFEYFEDSWNISDFAFQYLGICNISFQFIFPASSIYNTCSMSIVLVLALLKTMSWLRIFKNMSLLVAMIKQTFVDLVPFLTFFFIMVIVFTFIMGVLGFQNYKGNNNGNGDPSQEEDGANESPGVEYM